MSRAGRDVAGLTLRVAVGTVLIWAGLGKCCHTMPVQGEQAAALANLGLLRPAGSATAPPQTQPPATAPPSTTPPGDHAAPPKSEPERVETTPQAGFALVRVAAQTPAKPTAPAQQASAPTQARAYAAGDFPEPVEVKRWQGIALVLHEGQVNAQGRRLVPERVATNGPLLKYMALTVSWVELIGGSALVLGAMARMFALLGTCILGGAMWLTQLGPSLGAPGSLLGLFPNPHLEDPMLATTAWAPFLLQLLSMACCFALLLMGPGRLSADHWFWGEKPAGHDDLDAEDDDEEDED